MATASARMRQLEGAEDVPVGEFSLPGACWRDHYDRPFEAGVAGVSERHSGDALAREIIDAEAARIAAYQRYGDFLSDRFLHHGSSMTNAAG